LKSFGKRFSFTQCSSLKTRL